ncbi:probable disease resistance protein At1g61300 [Zingiber officinale]|uniref:probable disease resistance protein At1g61300 n=1 Tax=Zingiber officinale TaxID=94328 RepID=UPI001C4BA39D|nr:probable disease resistance protein At1g61300 [Zingiber officinale]
MAFIKLNLNVDVNSCLSGLWASLQLAIGRPKTAIKKLEKEMARLRGKRNDIKNQIGEAEREGKIPTNEVNQWLQEVEELEGQVADINQDFQSMISCFSCNCFSLTQEAGDQVPIREPSNCCSIIRRVVKKLGEANELMSRASIVLDPIATVGPPEPTVMLPIVHRPPVGIESYVEDIVGYIDGGEGNITGIYGMGGVGKTTVLKSIQRHYYNHRIIFDHVIWVVASKDCQLKRLQMEIARTLGLNTLQESDDEATCGDKLFSYLKNKNCLLLLDDSCEYLNLQLLGMAHSATEQGQQQHELRRKVVVFTTRSEIVCARLEAEKKIKVKCLDQDQAWQLFKENVDGDVLSSDRGINSCAQEIAKECAGLPLALITVARAMLGKKSWELWKDALHQIRDKHEWTSTIDLSEEDSVVMYKAFKLSYDSLENDSIRECLLCCALWPEDYEIHKFKELIPCWIGCGIIREFNVINEAFTKGCSHLEALMAASLLEHSSRRPNYYEAEHVKMHDVIRDMALLMFSELKGNRRKSIVKAGFGLHNLPRQEEWQEAERALFIENQIISLPEYEASSFPKLSMLILFFNYPPLNIPRSLFTSMPRLTYLDLSKCFIIELPMEIGSLTELQYLNLSYNTITNLPLELGCLDKLEYLLLRDNCLKTVPNGIISNLLMLKWLDISQQIPVCKQWWDELVHFRGCHQLSLEISIYATDLKRLNMLPNVSVRNLAMSGLSSKFQMLQWSLRVTDNLECLTISNVWKGDQLMVNAGVDCESSFKCLKTLNLKFLYQLKINWMDGVGFNNLRDLYISNCYKLKDVSWVLQLPCLNLLSILNCQEMEEIISNVGSSNSSFGIKMLALSKMDNLQRIAHQPLHFPYLEYISVSYCPRLKKLPFGAETVKNRLKEIQGGPNWWDDLDWDDYSIKDSLAPYFRDGSNLLRQEKWQPTLIVEDHIIWLPAGLDDPEDDGSDDEEDGENEPEANGEGGSEQEDDEDDDNDDDEEEEDDEYEEEENVEKDDELQHHQQRRGSEVYCCILLGYLVLVEFFIFFLFIFTSA